MTPPANSAEYAATPAVGNAVLAANDVLTWGRAPTRFAVSDLVRRYQASERRRRILNVVLAGLALLLATPLLLVIAMLVKLSSPGSVLYTQTRVGIDRRSAGQASMNHRRTVDYGGRLFRIYKFRTMRTDRGNRQQVWARPDDPRVTAIGRVLRKYRLDELPQLLNVLKGDMNLVGPRPEQPEILIKLRTAVDDYSKRQRVLPGLTGWAQINQRYDMTIEDVRRKVQLDLDYIRRCSTLEDLKIMARTVPVVLFQRGGW